MVPYAAASSAVADCFVRAPSPPIGAKPGCGVFPGQVLSEAPRQRAFLARRQPSGERRPASSAVRQISAFGGIEDGLFRLDAASMQSGVDFTVDLGQSR